MNRERRWVQGDWGGFSSGWGEIKRGKSLRGDAEDGPHVNLNPFREQLQRT